jgi:hypothetical protein
MLIDLLRDNFLVKAKSKYIKLIKKADRQIEIYLYLSSPVVACFTISWIVAPFINRKPFTNIDAKNFTKAEQSVETMIFVIWAPFDTEQSPQFEIITALQIVLVVIGIGILYAVNVAFLSMMSHLAAQFNLLVAMLDNMKENIKGDGFSSTETVPLPNSSKCRRDFVNNVKEMLNSTNDTTNVNSCTETEDNSRYSCFHVTFLERTDEQDNPDEVESQQYLVNCIKYHEAVIK